MLENFSITFLSIFLEAMPFMLLGTLVSSIIEVFVSKEWIINRFKNKKFYYFLLAGLMGIIFPVCECAIVPIVRRLIKKGTPTGIAVTFMLAVPIVNPTVLISTHYAFLGKTEFVYGRAILGYLIAIIVGFVIDKIIKKENVLKEEVKKVECHCHVHNEHHNKHQSKEEVIKNKVVHVLEHTAAEFMDVGRFLILGCLIATSMQLFIPKDILSMVSDNNVLSILLMMLIAFVLSLCSEADAFIASTFYNIFPQSSIFAFLVYGPMIDIKNTIMLSASFKMKFVVKLISVITIVCFIVILILNMFI